MLSPDNRSVYCRMAFAVAEARPRLPGLAHFPRSPPRRALGQATDSASCTTAGCACRGPIRLLVERHVAPIPAIAGAGRWRGDRLRMTATSASFFGLPAAS